MLFNVYVDSVVRNWLSVIVEDRPVVHDGLVHMVGQSLGLFYKNYGLLGSW